MYALRRHVAEINLLNFQTPQNNCHQSKYQQQHFTATDVLKISIDGKIIAHKTEYLNTTLSTVAP